MATKRLTADEIKLMRKILRLSEGEFADRIGLEDRRQVKLLEAGGMKPTVQMNRLLLKLLVRSAGRSPRLKKMLDTVKERSQERWA